MSRSKYLDLPVIEEEKVKELSELTDQICDGIEAGHDCELLINQFNQEVKEKQTKENFVFHESVMSTETFIKKSLICGNLPDSEFDDLDLKELISKLVDVEGSELEAYYWSDILKANVPDPAAFEYIYNDSLTKDEIFKKIKSYQIPKL